MKRLAAVLFVVGCLGGATEAYAAEALPPTVSVEGVANVPISPSASQAEADTAYRQGLTAAIGDGHEKAEFLAVQTGAKVGSVQQIAERGGFHRMRPARRRRPDERIHAIQRCGTRFWLGRTLWIAVRGCSREHLRHRLDQDTQAQEEEAQGQSEEGGGVGEVHALHPGGALLSAHVASECSQFFRSWLHVQRLTMRLVGDTWSASA